MSMDSTFQMRMDTELKAQVESLYRSLGTSFAEAVRVFAKQSIREGGMPFRPTLKTWDELTENEISTKLASSESDIANGQVYSQEALDARMGERFRHGQDTTV